MEREKRRLSVAYNPEEMGSHARQLVGPTNLILVSLWGWVEPINTIAHAIGRS